MWRERTSAHTAAQIRSDRGRHWWEDMRDIPRGWREHMGSVHAHPGPPKWGDVIFHETWGPDWRSRLASFTDREHWIAARTDFVKSACEKLGLPALQVAERTLPMQRKESTTSWCMSGLPVPLQMARDGLWAKELAQLQLELVVDNESLANIANGISSVADEFYRAPLDRICSRLLPMFSKYYE